MKHSSTITVFILSVFCFLFSSVVSIAEQIDHLTLRACQLERSQPPRPLAKVERPEHVRNFQRQQTSVYTEDFNDGVANGWQLKSHWVVKSGIFEGTGQGDLNPDDDKFNLWTNSYHEHNFDDFTFSCSIKHIQSSDTGHFGIIFRSRDGNSYILALSNERNWKFSKIIDKVEYTIQDWSSLSSIHSNDWNQIELSANSSSFYIYINGSYITSLYDASLTCGLIGVFVGNDTVAQFDDVRIAYSSVCDTPTPTHTQTPTNKPTPIPTQTPTVTQTFTSTPTPTKTPTTTPPPTVPAPQELYHFFDTNHNFKIDDNEILVLINYWSENRTLPPVIDFTPTPQASPTPTPVANEKEIIVDLPNLPFGATQLEMVYIEPGTFMMGSPSDERNRDSDETLHQVTLTKGFYMGKYEVTVGQYAAFLEATGKESGVDWNDGDCPLSRSGGNYSLDGNTFGQSWDQPMVEVEWYGAVRFCNYLSEKEGLQPVYTESGDWPANLDANGYRLPTEAEWEYACRAGTQTRFSHGDVLECDDGCDSCEIHNQYMWYCGNNSPNGTKEVGKKLPNPWGLYDMHGNIWEWCNDWYDSYYDYDQVDPIGKDSGSLRVLRGGVWYDVAWDCRSANRGGNGPDSTNSNWGFRVGRTP